MNICESLTLTARIVPDNLALIFGDQSLTYAELNHQSVAASQRLVELGVQHGDRVALMLPNSPSFPIWYYAALRIGAIVVSVNTRLAPAEVDFILSDCDAKAFIAPHAPLENISAAVSNPSLQQLGVNEATGLPTDSATWKTTNGSDPNTWYNADPNEAALILYTSGTTGFPKGATLSHANVRSNVHAFNHLCNMQPADNVLLAVPLFHCFGQNALLNSVLNVGGTIVLQQRFDLNESKQLIRSHTITQLYGVPMMFGLLLESCTPDDLRTVNYCFSAAATLPVQTSLAWQDKFGLPIYEGYGLTETSPFATYNHRINFIPGSIGMPIDSVEIKITDTDSPTAAPIPPGELGEIAIRGPNVMLGYWNRPEETATAIRDGWFHSGDIGRLDEKGYLFIVDRVKDMITVGGLKVFPAEVERVLLDHPLVSQAAVIGATDEVFGEQVIAYVVLTDDADQNTAINNIEQHAQANLGNYKIPRLFIPIDELPRNPSGKILKTKLREQFAEHQTNAASPGVKENDAAQNLLTANLNPPTLRQSLAQAHLSEKPRITIDFLTGCVMELGELQTAPDPSATFVEAGLDSLAIVALSAQLQHELGPSPALPPTLLFDYPRLTDLATFMVDTIAGNEQSTPTHQAPPPKMRLQADVEKMSEAEALDELMKELET